MALPKSEAATDYPMAAPHAEAAEYAGNITTVRRAWSAFFSKFIADKHACAPPDSSIGWHPIRSADPRRLAATCYQCPECGQVFAAEGGTSVSRS